MLDVLPVNKEKKEEEPKPIIGLPIHTEHDADLPSQTSSRCKPPSPASSATSPHTRTHLYLATRPPLPHLLHANDPL